VVQSGFAPGVTRWNPRDRVVASASNRIGLDFFSDMTLVPDDVCSRRRSGNYLLFLSVSHFDLKRNDPEKSWLTCLFSSPQKLSCTLTSRPRKRSALEAPPILLTRADRDRPLLGTYPAVSFAFDGGDKVRGEKVYECS
jgi:hypothetical protein